MKFRFVLEHGSAEREHAHMSVELLEREVEALRAAVSAERAKIARLERERSALQQQARELSVALKAAAREKKLLEAVIKDALRKRTGLDPETTPCRLSGGSQRPARDLAETLTFEPRRHWPRKSRRAAPAAPINGRRGSRLKLVVDHIDGRPYMPVVELKRAA